MILVYVPDSFDPYEIYDTRLIVKYVHFSVEIQSMLLHN